MTKPKRPKLGAVFGGGEGAPSAATVSQPKAVSADPPNPTESRMVQLNVAIPEAMRREVRVLALQRGVDVAEIVRGLLTEWLATERAKTKPE